jgi:hypothetical protein
MPRFEFETIQMFYTVYKKSICRILLIRLRLPATDKDNDPAPAPTIKYCSKEKILK